MPRVVSVDSVGDRRIHLLRLLQLTHVQLLPERVRDQHRPWFSRPWSLTARFRASLTTSCCSNSVEALRRTRIRAGAWSAPTLTESGLRPDCSSAGFTRFA